MAVQQAAAAEATARAAEADAQVASDKAVAADAADAIRNRLADQIAKDQARVAQWAIKDATKEIKWQSSQVQREADHAEVQAKTWASTQAAFKADKEAAEAKIQAGIEKRAAEAKAEAAKDAADKEEAEREAAQAAETEKFMAAQRITTVNVRAASLGINLKNVQESRDQEAQQAKDEANAIAAHYEKMGGDWYQGTVDERNKYKKARIEKEAAEKAQADIEAPMVAAKAPTIDDAKAASNEQDKAVSAEAAKAPAASTLPAELQGTGIPEAAAVIPAPEAAAPATPAPKAPAASMLPAELQGAAAQSAVQVSSDSNDDDFTIRI